MRSAGVVAIVLLAACDAPRPATPKLWTLDDVLGLYQQGAPSIAADAGLPGGIPLARIVDADGNLYPHPTMAEGYEATYLTTEVWSHFDEVWVQPLYIPVTGASSGTRTPVPGGAWIFSVGPASRFYSPFWQVFYVDVPDGTTPGTLASVRDVLGSGYPLEPGPGRTVALVPVDPAMPSDAAVKAPAGPTPIASMGWIDGQRQHYLDFGGATFDWNALGVVQETPLYVPVYRTAAGDLKVLGVTSIAAPGPRGANLATPPVVDGQPRYAAYWRLYLVVIPPPSPNLPPNTANVTVFAPPGGTGLYEQLQADGFPVLDYSDTIKTALATDPNAFAEYEGRVSLMPWGANGRPDCFDDPTLFPADQFKPSCGWLSMQSDVETQFAGGIIRTDVTVTCPFINLRGMDITPVTLR